MKNVILLSGGIDSAVCLAIAVKKSNIKDIVVVHADYGQPTENIEFEKATELSNYYKVRLFVRDIRYIISIGGLTQVGEDFKTPIHNSGVSTGFVPCRNLLLITIAVSLGASIWKKDGEQIAVWLGAQATDESAYADCRIGFIESLQKTLGYCSDTQLYVLNTPLINFTKTEVLKKAIELGVPLRSTYSCYKPVNGKPCGSCGACCERGEAFKELGIKDPLEVK